MTDSKITAIKKLDNILGNKRKFKRFIILLWVITPIIFGSIAIWRGCSLNTPYGDIKVKEKAKQ